MNLNYNPKLIKYARENRKKKELYEEIVWQYLRNRKFQGIKFRRQYPILNYIADFCSIEKKLVIELDGSQHLREKDQKYDYKRTKDLEKLGFKIIRIPNYEVLKHKSDFERYLSSILTSSDLWSPSIEEKE